MAVLTSVSGLNGKLPAAFILEIDNKRILLDLGKGPEPGVRPNAGELMDIDAIFLSHAHVDHVGSMDLWNEMGQPPVYASAATFRGLSPQGINLPESAWRILPLSSEIDILGLPFTVGRSGHAIGGIWLHSPIDGGVLYMGDWSRETTILEFDPPPKAKTLVTDVSYCDRAQLLSEQFINLAANAPKGAVLPVPPMGRGTEIALRLTQAGRQVAVCPVVAKEIELLASDEEGHISAATREALMQLISKLECIDCLGSHALKVVVEADHHQSILNTLVWETDFHFILTGHVAANSIGDRLLAQKRATRMGWNVHPPRSCNLWLADFVEAERVLPAFGAIEQAPQLASALGARLTVKKSLAF